VHCAKISHDFECQGQTSKVKVTRDKKALKPHNVLLFAADTPRVRTNGMRSLQTAAAADGPISWLPGGVFCVVRQFYAGVKSEHDVIVTRENLLDTDAARPACYRGNQPHTFKSS